MSKNNILIVAAFLLSFMVITSVARPDATLQSKSMEMEKKCETDECLMKTTSEAHLDYIYTQNPPPKLHAAKEMKKCETEECLMKTTSEAHLDYIYTQNPPPKPHALKEMEKKCETDECLIKATSDAHLDYIYTQRSPLKPHAVKVNP